jgi:His-Xaa-Ser system radical SAM maturase HxsC
MLLLHSRSVQFSEGFSLPRGVYRIASPDKTPKPLREQNIALCHSDDPRPELGFLGYVSIGQKRSGLYNQLTLSEEFSYLNHGDLILIDKANSAIRVLFRVRNPSNSLLLTERCNHYCVMCSQPPRDEDDSYLVGDILQAIPLMPVDTKEIGLTGGEPTLTGAGFLSILRSIKVNLPSTSVHVLSNGRNFQDSALCDAIGSFGISDLMIGIPLYAADPEVHDFVVQSTGAFDETLRGIINLKQAGVKVEIRVVLHKFTVPQLPNLAEFLVTNLSFVDHIAFMGLEAMGFGKSNWDDLWIHPREYMSLLETACSIAGRRGNRVSVYNLPLCWTVPGLLPYYVAAISDWKNDFAPECETCAAGGVCGGFFSSNLQKGSALSELRPFTLSDYHLFNSGARYK